MDQEAGKCAHVFGHNVSRLPCEVGRTLCTKRRCQFPIFGVVRPGTEGDQAGEDELLSSEHFSLHRRDDSLVGSDAISFRERARERAATDLDVGILRPSLHLLKELISHMLEDL